MLERLEPLYRAALARVPRASRRAQLLMGVSALVREAVRDQVHVRAATLSYWSLVTIVPVLVLAAAVLEPFGLAEVVPVRRLALSALLAGSVREVGTVIDSWIEQIDLAKLGLAGVGAVVFTSSRIWFSVEDAYNALWNTRSRRSFATRLVLFYTAFTVMPALLGVAWAFGSEVADEVDPGLADTLVPFLLTGVAFTGAIKMIPDTDVRWGPAVVGGAVSALAFELAKGAFNAYAQLLGAKDAAAKIYGSIGLFPVFLVWLYLLWTVVLVGVELAYVVQRREELLEAEHRRLEGTRTERQHADALFALQCVVIVGRRYADGDGPVAEAAVTRALASDPLLVRAALDTLEEAGVLAETDAGYLPAVPLDHLTVREVLERYRARTRPPTAPDAPGAELVAALLAPGPERLEATLAAVVERAR